jgi:hypothetical protein
MDKNERRGPHHLLPPALLLSGLQSDALTAELTSKDARCLHRVCSAHRYRKSW